MLSRTEALAITIADMAITIDLQRQEIQRLNGLLEEKPKDEE